MGGDKIVLLDGAGANGGGAATNGLLSMIPGMFANLNSKGGEVVVVPGTWHGKFKKEWPTEEEKKHIGKNGILNL